MRAWAWASGLIEFGHKCPDGAIVFAEGRAKRLREEVAGLARRGHKGELLVPGVPEGRGVEALETFSRLIREFMKRPETSFAWINNVHCTIRRMFPSGDIEIYSLETGRRSYSGYSNREAIRLFKNDETIKWTNKKR